MQYIANIGKNIIFGLLWVIHRIGLEITALTEPLMEAVKPSHDSGILVEHLNPMLDVSVRVEARGCNLNGDENFELQNVVRSAADSILDGVSRTILKQSLNKHATCSVVSAGPGASDKRTNGAAAVNEPASEPPVADAKPTPDPAQV